jgi:hypothetical protein
MSWVLWLIPVILATWEDEIRIQGQLSMPVIPRYAGGSYWKVGLQASLGKGVYKAHLSGNKLGVVGRDCHTSYDGKCKIGC